MTPIEWALLIFAAIAFGFFVGYCTASEELETKLKRGWFAHRGRVYRAYEKL